MFEPYLKEAALHIKEIIDGNTGESLDIEVRRHTYVVASKEEFFQTYSSLLGVFMKMDMPDIRVYGYLLQHLMTVSKIPITKDLRLEMSSMIHLNERTIYNTLKVLVEKGLLIRYGKLYQLNPRYAFKGSSSDRLKALKVVLELNVKNK
jgi:predicted transcriptional regulator